MLQPGFSKLACVKLRLHGPSSPPELSEALLSMAQDKLRRGRIMTSRMSDSSGASNILVVFDRDAENLRRIFQSMEKQIPARVVVLAEDVVLECTGTSLASRVLSY